jgi:hypothetical protein
VHVSMVLSSLSVCSCSAHANKIRWSFVLQVKLDGEEIGRKMGQKIM